MTTKPSRNRPVRVVVAVLPNSPHAHARPGDNFLSGAPVASGVTNVTGAAAHRCAHRPARSLATTGMCDQAHVVVSSAFRVGSGREGASSTGRSAGADTPRPPLFSESKMPGIPRKIYEVFSKLGLAGCFL